MLIDLESADIFTMGLTLEACLSSKKFDFHRIKVLFFQAGISHLSSIHPFVKSNQEKVCGGGPPV